MIEDLTPMTIAALGLIECAARAGSPLTREQLKTRLQYRNRGAVNRLVNALIEAGAVRADKKARPEVLRPVALEVA